MRGANNIPEAKWSGDWQAIKSLSPYLLEFPARVFGALAFMLLAKLANVAIPLILKYVVDDLDGDAVQLVSVPLALLLAYGALRFGSSFFGELRDAVFNRVSERAMRRIGLKVFNHLHQLELDFHLSRRTGGLSRDIERGTNGISFLLRFMLFNILPTLIELALIIGILLVNYSPWYAFITFMAVSAYIGFSILVTEWRTRFVREANEKDSQSNTRAIDSLLNFETVKYFGNEQYESDQYDERLALWEEARMKNRTSLIALNSGQALIISTAITIIMVMAARDVVAGTMTLGDLVLVNAFMIQLFIPLNFLGFVYREIKNALANIEQMFRLLGTETKVVDSEDASELEPDGGEVRFENVKFSYKPDREILHDVSFTIPAGQKIAIVGPSGSGKSTIARLLFRFYDVTDGAIRVSGQDIRTVTQESLRRAIGVVPQDTVLFNETIHYNIAYGNPGSSESEIQRATRMAHLEQFIERLPQGYATKVGERGLKLSGGEKQRIAIARTLLKNPCIMIFDEATSSLDSSSEKAILEALDEAAQNHTTLVIAHRLSTIIDADNILVLNHGRIEEQGSHQQLLSAGGLYAQMWRLQQQEQHDVPGETPEPVFEN